MLPSVQESRTGPSRTGLIGANGSGKSTLLQLIAGDLTPTAGSVSVVGTVGRLPQTLPLDTARTVSDLLGISPTLAALERIESGSTDPDDFTAVGDDWDIADRAVAALDRIGLREPEVLRRTVGTLSGGQGMLAGLAGLWLARPTVTLLDEPTNNLDLWTRQRLYDTVDDWPGVLVIVSHDRELLEHVDGIVDLLPALPGVCGSEIRRYGSGFTACREQFAAEQDAAARGVRDAEAVLRTEERQLAETLIKLDRRGRTARKAEAEKRVPKAVAHGRRSSSGWTCSTTRRRCSTASAPRTRRRNCCGWTSRPTTWTSRAWTPWSTPCPATGERCWWPRTIWRFLQAIGVDRLEPGPGGGGRGRPHRMDRRGCSISSGACRTGSTSRAWPICVTSVASRRPTAG